MSKLTLGLCALALVAGLAGCSGSESDGATSSSTTRVAAAGASTTTTAPASTGPVGDEASYTSSLATGLASGGDGGELQVTDGEAACVAPKWVATIGVDALVAKGVAADAMADPNFSFPDLDLSEEQAGPMVDAFTGCGVDIFVQFRKVLTTGLTATQATCVDGEISDADVRAFLSESLRSADAGEAVTQKITEVSQACDLPG
ncbi:hypothetical protein BH10ACT1_BH10ACT1_04840 [soil metagenome]